jgi:hypothetical protein
MQSCGFQATDFTLLYLPLKIAIIYNGTQKSRLDIGFHEFRSDSLFHWRTSCDSDRS